MDSTSSQVAPSIILVIEDDAKLRGLIALTLRQASYEIVPALAAPGHAANSDPLGWPRDDILLCEQGDCEHDGRFKKL